MAYDGVSTTLCGDYDDLRDYVRFREIELIGEEIKRHNVPGDIAEAGVDYGDCSWVINAVFPDRTMYLYDTFQGFDQRDVQVETQNNYTSKSFYDSCNSFKRDSFKTPEDQINFVKSRLRHPEKAIFRKGYFPETAAGEQDKTFAFVSLDMDLYQPIKSGIEFFYPKLSRGGYIMVHDYNNKEFHGIRDAVAECEAVLGPLCKVPLPDQGGTVIIMKP